MHDLTTVAMFATSVENSHFPFQNRRTEKNGE